MLASDPQFVPTWDDLDPHLLNLVAEAKRQLALSATIEPPAVERAPWRIGIDSTSRFLLGQSSLAQQLGQRGQPPYIGRHFTRWRKQQRLLALDESGVELRVRERWHGDEASEEVDVVRHADHAVLRQRLAHACKCLPAVGAP